MKKAFQYLLATLLLAIGFASCGEKKGEELDYTLQVKPAALTLLEDSVAQLQVAVVPQLPNGAEPDLTFRSADPSVATVNGFGRVTAISEGETTITIQAVVAGKDLQQTCKVTVKKLVKISPEQVELPELEATATLTCNVPDAKWLVRDASVATLSGNGSQRTITGKKKGTTFVVVSYAGHADSALITVGHQPLQIICDNPRVEITKTLKLRSNKANATWQIVSGANLATIDAQGLLTAKAATGTVVVSAQSGSEKVTLDISVWAQPIKVTPAYINNGLPNQPMVFTCNYYDLYGIDVQVLPAKELFNRDLTAGGCMWEGSAYLAGNEVRRENTASSQFSTVKGQFKMNFLQVSKRITRGSLSFSYDKSEQTATFAVQLPALKADVSAVNLNPNNTQEITTNYMKDFLQVRSTSQYAYSLKNVSPEGCVTATIGDITKGQAVKLKGIRPGTATLEIVNCGEKIELPIRVEPVEFYFQWLGTPYSRVIMAADGYPAYVDIEGVQAEWITGISLSKTGVVTYEYRTSLQSLVGGHTRFWVTGSHPGQTRLTVTCLDKTIHADITVLPSFACDKGAFTPASGNLIYETTTHTYSIAADAYKICGANNSYISPYYTGEIDLFGWNFYSHPTLATTTNADYATSGDITTTLTIDGRKYQMPTRLQLEALFIRNNYAAATVCGVKGYIFYPKERCYLPTTLVTGSSNYSDNVIQATTWNSLEAAGAIFLPCTGRRSGTSWDDSGDGFYWSGTKVTSTNTDGYGLRFSTRSVSDWYFYRGFAIRPVFTSLPQYLP